MSTGLNQYKKIIFSQWGEDGIIDEIFRRIGVKNKFCIEFGAGDGYECSNVWHLIKDMGWHALLMESDHARYKKWSTLKTGIPNLEILNTTVTLEGKNSLELIFYENNIPIDLDLLSVDIDGNDYHIFKGLSRYRPRVVIIEHNPTIPPTDCVIQNYNDNESFGASALANVELAHKKGYMLAAATHTNCIFVRHDEFDKLNMREPSLEEVFDRSGLSYIISAYNGSLHFKGSKKEGQPAFGWFYRGYTFPLFFSRIHALVFGPILKTRNSRGLAKYYRPIKGVFLGKQT